MSQQSGDIRGIIMDYDGIINDKPNKTSLEMGFNTQNMGITNNIPDLG